MDLLLLLAKFSQQLTGALAAIVGQRCGGGRNEQTGE
jgi:hypothetical protein